MNTVNPMLFPNLGSYLRDVGLTIDPIAARPFGIPIYWYGIILTSGIILGLVMASYMAKKENISPDVVLDFILWDILFAIMGARLYFVAFRWDDIRIIY